MIKVSKHAYKNAKKRLGYNKSAFDNTLVKIFEKWIYHWKTKWNLFKWITKTILSHPHPLKSILYADYMVLYKDTLIISVYKIPNNLLPISKYIK